MFDYCTLNDDSDLKNTNVDEIFWGTLEEYGFPYLHWFTGWAGEDQINLGNRRGCEWMVFLLVSSTTEIHIVQPQIAMLYGTYLLNP